MLLLCLTSAKLFCRTRSAFQAESNCSICTVTQSRRLRWWWKWFAWGPLLYHMQILEPFESGDNPVFKAASWARCLMCLWRKYSAPLVYFLRHVPQGKTQSHSTAPLKRVNRSYQRDYTKFYEVFYWLNWRSCVTSGTCGYQQSWDFPTCLSLSMSLSVCCLFTCWSSREVLQWRSLHHSVGVSHHKHLVQYCVVVDEALDHTRRLHILQVLFTEDNGHLWTGGHS